LTQYVRPTPDATFKKKLIDGPSLVQLISLRLFKETVERDKSIL
jgi:hypothetical protein